MRIQLDFAAVLSQWPLLLNGIAWTIALTTVATLIGMLLGILCAQMRAKGPVAVRFGVGAYIELIRNTPFIVQLFFIFFGLPVAGVRLSPETAAFIAIVLNLGAYAAEIVRAGVEATPRGQIEAAVSLALTPFQVFTRVVLPPALKKVWPATVSQIVIVMLGSSVCGQISVPELSYAANLIQSNNFRAFESFIVAALLYLALSVVLRKFLNWAGPRLLFGR
ncbi:amino acid ABC transporter permease [Telmatospirillum siberiense]|uniref:Polar amino acid ABC transporter permease n=1 Tax=Telmatospirillum siberiense TaxID=382514 RepID=A0A2N3PNA4_9PROT|nr:amino acid ABC transporter permease [Telmatospirillum siberiense]PKU21888.1 polar amino acid ABC transporter permease [Telmatospirillum siberiense]